MNPTATAVVLEIRAGHDEREVASRLKQRFNDRAGAIEREIAAFIADLRRHRLVEG